MVIAIVLIGSPLLTMEYYEIKGYTFREDVGIITQYKYNRIELNSNNDVTFENEIYIYSDYVYINEARYQTMYSQPELFEVGMMSAFYTVDLVNLYDFEFIYGHPFTSGNEIVISESVSIALFNAVNSIDESIIINDVEFIVSGVVIEPEDWMSYIFFSDSNIDTTSSRAFYKFVIFQDRDLHMKLYERGGIDLVFGTITINNQSKIDYTSSMVTFLLLLAATLFSLLSNSSDKDKLMEINKNPKQGYIKSLMSSFMAITIGLILFIVLFIGLLATKVSFLVALLFVTGLMIKYYWVLAVYLIPILTLVIKKILLSPKLCTK